MYVSVNYDVYTNMENSRNNSIPFPDALKKSKVTILGYGSLMSEKSARLTFPELTNFRYVKVASMRRVFAHPHLFLLTEGIIDPSKTLRLASLSVEQTNDEKDSFIAVAFDVSLDDNQRRAFMEREKAYKIISAPFYSLTNRNHKATDTSSGKNNDHYSSSKSSDKSSSYYDCEEGEGVICVASKDCELETSIEIHDSIKERGGVWHWTKDSGLLPADIYLRHCILSLEKVEGIAYDSFLNDTFLVDRKTTLIQYLENHKEEVMASEPPSHLSIRFGG